MNIDEHRCKQRWTSMNIDVNPMLTMYFLFYFSTWVLRKWEGLDEDYETSDEDYETSDEDYKT